MLYKFTGMGIIFFIVFGNSLHGSESLYKKIEEKIIIDNKEKTNDIINLTDNKKLKLALNMFRINKLNIPRFKRNDKFLSKKEVKEFFNSCYRQLIIVKIG